MKEQKTKQEWWCYPLPDSLETSLYNPVFLSDLCRRKGFGKSRGGGVNQATAVTDSLVNLPLSKINCTQFIQGSA